MDQRNSHLVVVVNGCLEVVIHSLFSEVVYDNGMVDISYKES